ncbi:WD domain, G-beta repeat containing protein [Babesia divergens]|uniref:WD domain, G-beta repeat containing protein n=1 Tax=Babesia divergens TaxID=32595 RepID=A0AAD9LGU3_BABDI|nr:WD domain, G-beta repeat containing protein [Babesia divergens]
MVTDRKRRCPSSHEPMGGDAAAQRADHETDDSVSIRDRPALAAGYIVGELPVLICRDNFLSVINNQKCTLYDCKQACKLADTYPHRDMIVSCDTYAYTGDTDILLVASYDGILKVYLVNKHEKEQLQHVLLATLRIASHGLLCVKTSKTTGDIVFVYTVNEPSSATVVAWMTLNYDALMESDDRFDAQNPIIVEVASMDNQESKNSNDEHTEEGSSLNVKANILESSQGNGSKDQEFDQRRNDALCKTFVKGVRCLCTLPSRVDVFATDANLEAIAFAIGKTAMILNIQMKKILFFECFASISCIAFFRPNVFAVGDSRGRIALYNIDTTAKSHGNDNLVVACDMPEKHFDLSASYFKKILLAFHSSSADPKYLADCKEFYNFNKVTASVNALIWHAHGVNCLTFNSDGTMLLSGGEEGVLVIWHLKSGAKKFVTRIGSAIFHILCQRDHGMYILCCEANEILFVDPFALCIRKRISGITVPINIGMNVNKDVNVSPTNKSSSELLACGNTDINRAHVCLTVGGEPTVPLIQHWPTNLTEVLAKTDNDEDTLIGGNVAVYARSNKLQIYNYVHDREVGSLSLKSVNILSRQDDDFGEDWELEELLISSDGYVVVTVQSRNVLNKLSETNNGTSGVRPEFEHEVLTNNRKGLLKFWVKQKSQENKNSMMGDFVEHTKISNPHSHKTTSIRQLNDMYTFLTTSMDSEFKVWRMIRKRILKSDNLFETYRVMDIHDADYHVDITDPNSYMWVCVAVASYKNMPCFASSITSSGTLLAISHDVVVTFWKVGAEHSCIELLGAAPLPNNEGIHKEECNEDGDYRLLTFLYPNEPNLILYSKRTQLCVLDITKGTTLWRYPIAAGQIIDKIVYTPQLPNVLVVSSSTISETAYGCSGMLEVFWLSNQATSELTVEQLYCGSRDTSRIVLNMCLAPAAFGQHIGGKRVERGEINVPLFKENTTVSTLVLLTTNFNLETLIILSDLYGTAKPRVIDIRSLPKQQTQHSKTPLLLKSPQFDIIAYLMATAKAQKEGTAAKKRAKYNLADQLCKSNEWRYRVKHPMPKCILSAVVDPGCPTAALPPPNVVLNRLLHLVTVKHQTHK